MMTESEAWRAIALAFTRPRGPDYDGVHPDYILTLGNHGLCHAAHVLWRSGYIDYQRYRDMLLHVTFFEPCPEFRRGGYYWPKNTVKGRERRVIAACFLSAMIFVPYYPNADSGIAM